MSDFICYCAPSLPFWFSDHLGQPLKDYVDQLDKVKLIRLPERSGLMQARMAGFHHVTGQVAAFLDSHCEVPEGKQSSVFKSIRSQAPRSSKSDGLS